MILIYNTYTYIYTYQCKYSWTISYDTKHGIVWDTPKSPKEPVLEMPMTCRPAQAYGQQWAWIAVGSWAEPNSCGKSVLIRSAKGAAIGILGSCSEIISWNSYQLLHLLVSIPFIHSCSCHAVVESCQWNQPTLLDQPEKLKGMDQTGGAPQMDGGKKNKSSVGTAPGGSNLIRRASLLSENSLFQSTKRSTWKCSSTFFSRYTLWQTNIAMENHHLNG